jgi:hypothetical protein
VPVHPPDIDGDDVQFDEASTREAQLTKITARIVDLVARQSVVARDIVVLIALRPTRFSTGLGPEPVVERNSQTQHILKAICLWRERVD